MLRIGVLLPRSTLFPALGLDILNGIKCCLKYYGLSDNIKLLTDNIGFGIEEAEIYSKAEKFLLQDDADIVIVVADLNITELLEPLFTTSNKIMLMVNMGAGIPDKWQTAPTTIVHSLNLSFHTRLTGKLAAAENENKKGAYTLSYYDAGYRHAYSMMNSHQQNGGEPMYTHVTHLRAEQFTLAPLEEFLTIHEEVKTLLCLFTAEMADQFYAAIVPIREKLQLNLYASPMLLEAYPHTTNDQEVTAPPLKGYTCWLPELDNPENTVYKENFKKTANKEATLFGMLGWETGLILKEILNQYQQNNTNAAEVVPALCKITFNSPRGWMKMDQGSYHTFSPSYLVSWSANGKTKEVKELLTIENEWKEFTAEQFPEDTSSGWRNTYLCI
ncbi:MAG: ABC transporter substrate-binding protein [Chitinophagaceae bacterium]|nr:ABC transporter substrate-binding protein [Chitinophagaceae bacterium]